MRFYADLHVHSRYSRATSRDADLEHLALWARRKGAHSPPMLGREACSFDTDLDYFAIRRALETGEGYGGTVEFFPEEDKYHLDGHRACGVRLEPAETREVHGLCPACGKPLTVGVMHRVEELADRGGAVPEARRIDPFRCLVAAGDGGGDPGHRPLLEQPGVSKVIKALRGRTLSGSVEAALDEISSAEGRVAAERRPEQLRLI